MWRQLYNQFFRKKKITLIFLIIIIGIGTGISAVNPYVYGKMIDSIVDRQVGELEKWLLIFFVILVLTQLLDSVETILGNWVVNGVENDIKNSLMSKVLSLKCKELDRYQEGELLNRLEFDAETITNYYLDMVTSILMIAFNLIISVYFILMISIKLSLIAFGTFFLIYAVNFLFRKKIYRINKSLKKFEDKYFGFVNDIFSNLKAVKAYRIEEKVSMNYRIYLNKKLKILMKNVYITKVVNILRGLLGNCMNVLILFFSGMAIIAGKMTIGNMVAFNSYLEKFFVAISKLMELNLNRQSVLVSFERINEIERMAGEEKEKGTKLEEKIHEINCAGIEFSYDNTKVLDQLDMNIDSPGLYSLAGENGCGKTTLLKILEQFYSIEKGNIMINHDSIQDYSLETYRNSVFYMAKEPFFLQDTILSNLCMGSDVIEKTEVVNACVRTEIHEAIIALPEGYHTQMEKAGKNFSSGQKQKLGIARALLSQASLYLLDEVTSDLDGAAEKRICNILQELAKDSIVIQVAHKQECLARSAQVFYMEKGRICASGTHEQLKKQCEGYGKLFENQEESTYEENRNIGFAKNSRL